MISAGALTFREFAMREQLPLATLHEAILEFLRERSDAVLLGAHAVNAYVGEPRMTQDIDLLSTRAGELAQDLVTFLSGRFHIAARAPQVAKGRGFRVYQVRKSGNRHLVDLQSVEKLPASQRIEKVLVMNPPELIAQKVIAYHNRRGQPKAGTDWRDLAMLLLTFPELKNHSGPVNDCLRTAGASESVLATWDDLVAQEIKPPDEDNDL